MKEQERTSAQKPYEGGKRARSLGVPLGNNPYPKNSPWWKDWNEGWHTRDVKMKRSGRSKP